jgi:glycine/D-amino acid oxidase-like deaminating enzyme
MTPAEPATLETRPFWWQGAPPPEDGGERLPRSTDVLVIGAGYSGLFTALALARGDREVVVVEADRPGLHASTRNFGAVGRTIRVKFSDLAAREGLAVAKRVYEEAKAWLEWTADFIERERIDCGFRRAGRVVAAHSPRAFDAAAREVDLMAKHLPLETEVVPPSRQHEELGSDVYHGALVLRDVGHLDPARYFEGVYRLALAAGVRVIAGTRVGEVAREAGGFRVRTAAGEARARDVVLTTNAETGKDNPLFRYFHRRVVPIGVYSVVTEPLDGALIASVLPTGRAVLETRRLYLALRPIEGEDRLLAVGRHMTRYDSEREAAEAVRRDLVERYPQLAGVRLTHCWRGRFCVTFDWLPHLGIHEGVHYLIGLNGAGVPACGYLGHKLALRMLSRPNEETVFADRPYPGRPGYTGSTWFLPLLAAGYRLADRRESGLGR